MIAWSIRATQASGCFDQIIVSTDDPKAADLARHWEAEFPFIRPAEIVDNFAGTTSVFSHPVK